MQYTFKNRTAMQILTTAETDADGRVWVTVDDVQYEAIPHPRVELNNGDWTPTLVLTNARDRIVLRVPKIF
jgi:hypothetical protein